MGLAAVIDAKSHHTTAIAAQGLALALLTALVFCTNHPFRGDLSVSPAPLERALAVMRIRG